MHSPLRLAVGVTAHRDLVAAEGQRLEQAVHGLFEQLESDFPDLPLELLTPLAEGGDQLAARVALDRGIPVTAVLPMTQSEYEQDFRAADALAAFRDLVNRSERVIELPDMKGPEATRDMQYAQVGVFISNHSQVLLALWDGKAGGAFAGTSQVVNYRLNAVMEGFEADPTPGNLLVEKENDLVCHVACSRDRDDGAVAGGLKPGQLRWLTGRAGQSLTDDLPPDHRRMFSNMQEFLRDIALREEDSLPYDNSLLQEAGALALPSAAALADQLFRSADALAIRFQRKLHGSLRLLYAMAVLMGLLFLFYTEFDASPWLVFVFLAMFFIGLGVHLLGERREWHRKYLDYRALAEGLRVQLYWNLSGVADNQSADFAFDNFLQSQDPDLGWIRHVMRRVSLERVRGERPAEAWLEWVIEQWIGATDGPGQLGWYRRKERTNTLRYRRTRRLGSLCLWTGIAIAAVLFTLEFTADELSDDWQPALLMLMGSLPLIAGIWDAYSHKMAEKELIKQYGFMTRVFARARQLIDSNQDNQARRDILHALGMAALEEGAEWLIMHRERPLEHGGLQSV